MNFSTVAQTVRVSENRFKARRLFRTIGEETHSFPQKEAG
jgi:hypothetical protein